MNIYEKVINDVRIYVKEKDYSLVVEDYSGIQYNGMDTSIDRINCLLKEYKLIVDSFNSADPIDIEYYDGKKLQCNNIMKLIVSELEKIKGMEGKN